MPAGIFFLLIGFLLASCATVDGPPVGARAPLPAPDRAPPDAVPRTEPPANRGNPESYVVLGKRYFVLPSNEGYVERGIASWYGTKFHGRSTSSGERYNMYEMTAAHKTLRLPAYARVTNLRNGKQVTVRVNDRGPFHDSRLIDLSYAAAQKLEMLGEGTALVEVAIVQSDGSVASDMSRSPGWRDESHLQNRIYVQVGAFTMRDNADRLFERLRRERFENVQITQESDRPLLRVRIGPLSTVLATDQVVERLQKMGLAEHQVVVE
ncbi:MAG TPA: septal ring lytic transglycosylase RlpA family protein [Gammaproteobacteria bacterium]|nr:septal ring lytic transglycosylase RlpA family protein [Gammaproteobacteria bacterium]